MKFYYLLPDLGPTINRHSDNCIVTENENGSLSITSSNSNPIWIVFPLDYYWNNIPIPSDWKLNIEIDIKDSDLRLYTESKTRSSEKYQIITNDKMKFSCSDILDIYGEQEIMAIKLVGILKTPITIERLVIGHPSYITPIKRPKHVCIYPYPHWDRGFWRKQEREVQHHIKFSIANPKENDIVYIRPNEPDVTNDIYNQIQTFQTKCKSLNCTILNPIETLYNYKLKDRTFNIWRRNNIPIPDYQRVYTIDEVKSFASQYSSIILRINDVASSDNTYIITKNTTPHKLRTIWSRLNLKKDERLSQGHIGTSIIVVERIPPDNNYSVIGRAYIVKNKILNSHTYTYFMGKEDKLNLTGFTPNNDEYFKKFVDTNRRVLAHQTKYKDIILKSTSSLNLDLCCIEYVIKDDDTLFFLEANAFWGSGIFINPWPYTNNLIDRLNVGYADLKDIIPNVYDRMDEHAFWKRMYNAI